MTHAIQITFSQISDKSGVEMALLAMATHEQEAKGLPEADDSASLGRSSLRCLARKELREKAAPTLRVRFPR